MESDCDQTLHYLLWKPGDSLNLRT